MEKTLGPMSAELWIGIALAILVSGAILMLSYWVLTRQSMGYGRALAIQLGVLLLNIVLSAFVWPYLHDVPSFWQQVLYIVLVAWYYQNTLPGRLTMLSCLVLAVVYKVFAGILGVVLAGLALGSVALWAPQPVANNSPVAHTQAAHTIQAATAPQTEDTPAAVTKKATTEPSVPVLAATQPAKPQKTYRTYQELQEARAKGEL